MSLISLAGRSAAATTLRSRSAMIGAACVRCASAVIAAPAPASAFAACSSVAPAVAARSFHASSSALGWFSGSSSKDTPPAASSSAKSAKAPTSLDLEKSKAAAKVADQSAKQAAAEATFWAAMKNILLRPEFKLKDYEELAKLQAGGGTLQDTSNMSFIDRTKYQIREKVQNSGMVPVQETHAELKPLLEVFKALSEGEKDTTRASLPMAVRERVALATGQTLPELGRFLMKFDQMAVTSQWFRWRVANRKPLPANHQQMQEWMSDDRREKKFDVKTKLEMALKPKVRRAVRR